MPCGLEANLDYIAIHEADYGATRNHKIVEHSPPDSMVTIELERKVDPSEALGWEGFTSENMQSFTRQAENEL